MAGCVPFPFNIPQTVLFAVRVRVGVGWEGGEGLPLTI